MTCGRHPNAKTVHHRDGSVEWRCPDCGQWWYDWPPEAIPLDDVVAQQRIARNERRRKAYREKRAVT